MEAAWARPRVALQSTKMRQQRSPQGTIRRWRILALSATAVLLLFGSILVAVPAVSPAAGAATADFLRSVVGPEPVAQLESLSYWMRDTIYRMFPAIHGSGPPVSWSGGTGPAPDVLVDTPTPTAAATQKAASGAPDPAPMATVEQTPLPSIDVVTALPQIGWQAYGPVMAGTPLMSRAMVMVDPDRSYAGVALVRMDLSQLQLHVMAGFIEPAHPSGINALIPNLGMISPKDQSQLIAAFNGGFKAIHGHYGMMVNGIMLLQPLEDLATVAVYRNGSMRLGAWGREVFSSPDMIAFRQNCPPLVENGEINPALATSARKVWGLTNNTDVTWRTGLGLTQDRRFLVYAVGNGTTVQFLAEALLKAGAYNAMQLDINQYYSHFVTYSNMDNTPDSSGSQLQAQRLLEQMINIRKLFLIPYPRDFFYLTVRR